MQMLLLTVHKFCFWAWNPFLEDLEISCAVSKLAMRNILKIMNC